MSDAPKMKNTSAGSAKNTIDADRWALQGDRMSDLDKARGRIRKKMAQADDLIEQIDNMAAEQLHARIAQAEFEIISHMRLRVADDELTELEERVKALKSQYTDPIAAQKAVVEYCTLLLEQRGKV